MIHKNWLVDVWINQTASFNLSLHKAHGRRSRAYLYCVCESPIKPPALELTLFIDTKYAEWPLYGLTLGTVYKRLGMREKLIITREATESQTDPRMSRLGVRVVIKGAICQKTTKNINRIGRNNSFHASVKDVCIMLQRCLMNDVNTNTSTLAARLSELTS